MNTKSKKSSKSNARNKAARKVVKRVKRGVKTQRPTDWAAERKVGAGVLEIPMRYYCKPGLPKDARRLAMRIGTRHNEVTYVVYRGKKVVERSAAYKPAAQAYKRACKAK